MKRLFPIVALALVSPAFADDNVRLLGKPADRDDVRRLDIKPDDKGQDDTELTRYRYGVRFYGGYGYYGGYGFYGYRSYASFGYRPYSYAYYGPSFGYYAPSYYYSYPVYSYSHYCSPVYYSAPPVYYSSPYVIYTSVATAPAIESEPRATTYRYDGDRTVTPTERIPPARIESPAVPELPKPPTVPKLGPSPTERMVSAPAPSTKKKYSYPAYGEDRETPRDDKSLLIRRDK